MLVKECFSPGRYRGKYEMSVFTEISAKENKIIGRLGKILNCILESLEMAMTGFFSPQNRLFCWNWGLPSFFPAYEIHD